MKKLFPLFAVFGLLVLLFGWTGCATLPLNETEITDYHKATNNCSDTMKAYTKLQKSANRTPISVKIIRDPDSNNLEKALVKSRKIISPWTIVKKFLLREKITRPELEIRTELY